MLNEVFRSITSCEILTFMKVESRVIINEANATNISGSHVVLSCVISFTSLI